MNILALLLFTFCFQAIAQNPEAYLSAFDSKVYSLKSKGVKDFVVDIESSKLKNQLNEQMTFGKINQLVFRTYWTASPERLAIEVIGLPEGFKEVKEELKFSILQIMDNLIPLTMAQRFPGHKFSLGPKAKEFVAQDTTGLAQVPSYILRFNGQDGLTEIEGKRPVGTFISTPVFEKTPFSDGRWVLMSQTTVNSENGQTLKVKKQLEYGALNGITVVKAVVLTTEQYMGAGGAKPLTAEDTLEFKQYKINTGAALKHFLGTVSK